MHPVHIYASVVILIATASTTPQEGITIHISGPASVIINIPDTTEEGNGGKFDATGSEHANVPTADQCTGAGGICVKTGDRCNGTIKVLHNSCNDHCTCCVPEKHVPWMAPKNLTLVVLRDATTALLAWEPVSNESIRGHFKGYKIQTWTENDSVDKARDIIVENNAEAKALVDSFVPYSMNFVRVLVFNGTHDGPPSEIIHFNTPEGVPGPVNSLDAIPMGSSALFLTWKTPKQHNGILTGYNIYYQEVQGTETLDLSARDPQINDPEVSSAKLASLKPATKYRITVKAKTVKGEGTAYYIERKTRAGGPTPPGKPLFIWQHVSTTDAGGAIRIIWIPNTTTNPGSHFYVQYRLYGKAEFQATKAELYDEFTVLKGLEVQKTYEVRIVAVDGDFQTYSDIDEIVT